MTLRLVSGRPTTFILGLILAIVALGASADENKSPTALVEMVMGAEDTDLEAMDYVSPGQVIDLGDSGYMILSYLLTCRIETITGGKVTVGHGESEVEEGEVQVETAPCQGNCIEISQATQGTAGTVYRVAAFDGTDWNERTIQSAIPIFLWNVDGEAGLAAITVLDLDRDPPAEIWKGVTDGKQLEYPSSAPTLEVGIPYQVQVSIEGQPQLIAVFSIDPELEGPDTMLSRLVPVIVFVWGAA